MIYIKKFESKSEIEKYFKKALDHGSSSVSDDFYSEASEYHVYEDYFIYDDIIFHHSSRPSGDWYHTEIVKSKLTKKMLMDKIEKEIDILEKAYNKLYNI
jgi:hypothetical protein